MLARDKALARENEARQAKQGPHKELSKAPGSPPGLEEFRGLPNVRRVKKDPGTLALRPRASQSLQELAGTLRVRALDHLNQRDATPAGLPVCKGQGRKGPVHLCKGLGACEGPVQGGDIFNFFLR